MSSTAPTTDRAADYEEPFYWTTGSGFYGGKYPPWFDVSDSPLVAALEAEYPRIKAEVLDFYEQRSARLRPNWLQWGYTNAGWLTLDLYSLGMRTPRNCAEFPFLDQLVRSFPEMMSAQVAVLQPNTRIRPHVGETTGLIRCHLPLVVPGTAPDLGIRVGAETRCWEEGKVIALNIAYRHYAWNFTDQPRLIVVVDYVNPDFADRKAEIQANALATTAMKAFAAAFPRLKPMPVWVTRPTQRCLAAVFRLLGAVERRWGIAWSGLASKRPPIRRIDLPDQPASSDGATRRPVDQGVQECST